jgi:acyl carrier protein
VLGIEQVGVHDNFLDLGGDSLLAARLAARVHETFRVQMPLRALLESPTVAAMAVTIVAYLVEHTEAEHVSRLLSQVEGFTDLHFENHTDCGRGRSWIR